MKILSEAPGQPTVIELNRDESAIIFFADGRTQALMAGPEKDLEEDAKPSAIEMVIALTALSDPTVRAMIEERISNA